MRERFVVTTSHRPKKEQVLRAKELAKELGADYVPRRKLKELIDYEKIDFYYVVEKDGRIVIRWENSVFFFHPSVAKVRMKNIEKVGKDYLIEALDLKGNEVVLDTTFGLGSEAILIAAFLPNGKVVGLEKSKHIYTVVKYGLRDYKPNARWIAEAMKRIELHNEDFKEYVRRQPGDSFDVVYCDPMFENPKYESSALNPLRPFASYDTVTPEDVEEMIRVARKRVVLKSHEKDSLFERIKVDEKIGSKKSGVVYGIIHVR